MKNSINILILFIFCWGGVKAQQNLDCGTLPKTVEEMERLP